ncbi:MAG: NAD-binding protein, partial [Bacteroidaceae bacterium]|nr:NAD-binding protein [Bacteroidaceae bacterium]
MKIVIGGAGAVGTHLATLLSRERHDIVLIDENSDKIRKLSSNLDIMSYSGKPASIEVQKQAGVGSADLFIGVTPDETCNVTCCMIASTLGCRKTVA